MQLTKKSKKHTYALSRLTHEDWEAELAYEAEAKERKNWLQPRDPTLYPRRKQEKGGRLAGRCLG